MKIEQELCEAKRELDALNAEQGRLHDFEMKYRAEREALAIPKIAAQKRFDIARDRLVKEICKCN